MIRRSFLAALGALPFVPVPTQSTTFRTDWREHIVRQMERLKNAPLVPTYRKRVGDRVHYYRKDNNEELGSVHVSAKPRPDTIQCREAGKMTWTWTKGQGVT